MNDLIYRKDVIEDYIAGFGLTIEDIEKIPAVDAEPVKHGHWIPTGKERPGAPESIRCSECGFWYIRLTPRFYCSNCGARMDEESRR